jgi:hypothetical protein
MSAAGRWGWRILVVVSALLLLNGVALYVIIVDTHTERTIGVLLAAFAALALAVAFEGLRHGSRWAWHASWVTVASLAAVGLHSLRGDRMDLPVWYLSLSAIALAGQLMAGRSREP